ncbi:MAG: HAD family hydrolase [Peptostreptococcaceae bacterium]
MYKLAIFDLDGTLLNTLEDLANACNYALNKMGLPTHEVEKYKTFVGGGRYKLISGILPAESRNEETINKTLVLFDEYYESHMIDMTKPYDGICEMLEDITNNGVEVAIVSNKPHEFTIDVVEKFFEKTFKIVYGHRVGYPTKPEPESVLQIINEYKLDKNDCVYIGDSNVDIKTAINANIKSIGVAWGFRGREELENEGADFIVETSEELKSVILKQKVALGEN